MVLIDENPKLPSWLTVNLSVKNIFYFFFLLWKSSILLSRAFIDDGKINFAVPLLLVSGLQQLNMKRVEPRKLFDASVLVTLNSLFSFGISSNIKFFYFVSITFVCIIKLKFMMYVTIVTWIYLFTGLITRKNNCYEKELQSLNFLPQYTFWGLLNLCSRQYTYNLKSFSITETTRPPMLLNTCQTESSTETSYSWPLKRKLWRTLTCRRA